MVDIRTNQTHPLKMSKWDPQSLGQKKLRSACLVVDLLRFGSREVGVLKFLRDYGVPHGHGLIDWICLFGCGKKFQTKFSQMVVV